MALTTARSADVGELDWRSNRQCSHPVPSSNSANISADLLPAARSSKQNVSAN